MDTSLSRASFAEQLIEQNLLQTKHAAIYDYKFQKALQNAPWQEWLSKPGYFEVADEYKERFHEWILNNQYCTVTGLDCFKHRDLINGTTQAFDEAYHRYNNRRLRIRRGEYAYHRRVVADKVWLEDEELNANDWIILSWPFCGTGNTPENIKELLDDALDKNIPVLIDCAWYGTCYNIDIDLTHPAITEVTFSLTKSTGTGNIRSGIRYSNYDDNFPVRQQNNYNHLVLGAAQIGLWMMDHFPSDWQVKNYLNMQHQLCQSIGVLPSNTLHIALADGTKDWHRQFLMDNTYYKIGIRQALKAIRKKELTL